MKVLVTGSNGFVGKNLISNLSLNKEIEILKYDIDSSMEDLDIYTKECDFLFHLAGVNRPNYPKEFMENNFGFTDILLKKLEEPPKHVKFILATTEPQKLPATILSRCQRFDFKKISDKNITKRLEIVCKESNIEISKEALEIIATLA